MSLYAESKADEFAESVVELVQRIEKLSTEKIRLETKLRELTEAGDRLTQHYPQEWTSALEFQREADAWGRFEAALEAAKKP